MWTDVSWHQLIRNVKAPKTIMESYSSVCKSKVESIIPLCNTGLSIDRIRPEVRRWRYWNVAGTDKPKVKGSGRQHTVYKFINICLSITIISVLCWFYCYQRWVSFIMMPAGGSLLPTHLSEGGVSCPQAATWRPSPKLNTPTSARMLGVGGVWGGLQDGMVHN